MKKLSMLGVLALVGCSLWRGDPNKISVVSPDGDNQICLWRNPLSYEVVRDGVTVVARTEIGLTVDGKPLDDSAPWTVSRKKTAGKLSTPIYKKTHVDLEGNESFVDFGDWGIRLAARNDGVAYRFETKKPGRIKVNGELADVTVPDAGATCWTYVGKSVGCEEVVNKTMTAAAAKAESSEHLVYLPFVYTVGGKTVAVTESDVRDYPIWNLGSKFDKWPTKKVHVGNKNGWGKNEDLEKGGRWISVRECADYLVETDGIRTFPWRAFVLADEPAKLCESDLVYALAAPSAAMDFSWVRPGKVAWDWWNSFDNQTSEKAKNGGCNTETYRRFIDFAAKNGVEYVIFDEGWSAALDIWKFHPDVDVKGLIDYANSKGVGIILWMAWAQVYGEEEKVASHFAELGAKGFKVDFMDRGDADVARFLEKFAAACARNRMLIDYHGAYRPTGLQRKFPNVLNYEGIHGLENMKWHKNNYDFMANDVSAFFCRMTAGAMDYTPGAMDNYPIGKYEGTGWNPGSVGTRCRQMAMMAMYEAPLQMLCDSPTKYEKNMESFSFMAATPVVWDETVGLGGCPDSYAAVARRKGEVWYAAAMTNQDGRDFVLDTSFLGKGAWKAEIFRDADDADVQPTHYVHEQDRPVEAGESLCFRLAPGGAFIVRFTK